MIMLVPLNQLNLDLRPRVQLTGTPPKMIFEQFQVHEMQQKTLFAHGNTGNVNVLKYNYPTFLNLMKSYGSTKYGGKELFFKILKKFLSVIILDRARNQFYRDALFNTLG